MLLFFLRLVMHHQLIKRLSRPVVVSGNMRFWKVVQALSDKFRVESFVLRFSNLLLHG